MRKLQILFMFMLLDAARMTTLIVILSVSARGAQNQHVIRRCHHYADRGLCAIVHILMALSSGEALVTPGARDGSLSVREAAMCLHHVALQCCQEVAVTLSPDRTLTAAVCY
jgi:hypothetical protein